MKFLRSTLRIIGNEPVAKVRRCEFAFCRLLKFSRVFICHKSGWMNQFLPWRRLCSVRFVSFSEVQFIFPDVGLQGVHFILQGLELFFYVGVQLRSVQIYFLRRAKKLFSHWNHHELKNNNVIAKSWDFKRPKNPFLTWYEKSAHEGLFYGSPTTRIDGNRSKVQNFFCNTVL